MMKELSNYLKQSSQIRLSLHSMSEVTDPLFISFSLDIDNKIDNDNRYRIRECVQQNVTLWKEIHECIKINNLKQLMTLLSTHTVNLNSLNLSTDGDTILHSAAKSNSMEMIEFVLQRISLNTKQRMRKMRNKQGQLPDDLLTITRWTPSIHLLFPLKFRQAVKAVLMLGAKRQDGTPYYPQAYFYKLPRDVLFIILEYAAPDYGQ
jgi:ankyrin repeat protein